jgi:ribonuclease HI
MGVTIIADASWCPITRVGGYGCWINAGSRGSKSHQAMLNGFSGCAGTAEMKAIANALHHSMASGLVLSGDHVLIQSDCVGAIEAFNGRRSTIKVEEKEVAEWFRKFTVKHGIGISFKHVKGHTNKSEARFVSNQICDRRAKEEMRRARNLFKLDEIRQKIKR